MQAALDKVAERKEITGRLIAELFLELPDASLYPDYYEEVGLHYFDVFNLLDQNPYVIKGNRREFER